MKNVLGLAAALTTLGYILYTIYESIAADGTWYNQLYMDKGRSNVTFTDKLLHTLKDQGRSINPVRVTVVTAALPIAAYIITRIIVAGIQNF